MTCLLLGYSFGLLSGNKIGQKKVHGHCFLPGWRYDASLHREYATANELTFSQIFRLSWFIANGQAYVLALRRSRSNFWAQVASPLDVQLMRDPLLCSVAGSTACRCHDLARPKINRLIHHPALLSWTSFASSSWSSSLWSSSSPSSSSSTEDPWVMNIYHSTVSPGTTACYLLHSSSIKQWSHGWGWSSLRAPETKSSHNFAF